MRKVVLGVIIAIAVTALFLFARARLSGHRIELKANFHDAQGLRQGAPVRVAGVDVGSVSSVRVRPELREHAAEVLMDVHTPYELKIPRDSIATLATAGVLGETFVEIDVAGASGEPANNGTVLKSKETEPLSTKDFIEKVGDALQRKPCDSDSGDRGSNSGPNNQSGQKPHPFINEREQGFATLLWIELPLAAAEGGCRHVARGRANRSPGEAPGSTLTIAGTGQIPDLLWHQLGDVTA